MEKGAAIYARVSTDEQNPENQLHELRAYCDRQGFVVVDEFIDTASGAKESRPALDLLMQAARRKEFDVLVCWKLDRLGRSLQHLLQVTSELRNLGIGFISTTQGFDTTRPEGRLIFGILGSLAEFERELIKERIYLGMKRARKQGKHMGRPKGRKDTKKRKKSGYYLRWKKGA